MHLTDSVSAPEWARVRATFQQVWGYDDFRPPQGDIVRSLLCGRDALVVMPTGGGKSICFQLPALLQTGLTLVVSPLVALMENQVQELREKRLPAALLHSELPPRQRQQTLWQLERGKLRLLYLSPETLLSVPVWKMLSQPRVQIRGLILDEAHCLVQWGDSFRPAYRRLGAVRPALLATKPAGTPLAIAAFTATADPQAQRTIREVLGLNQPQVFLQNPYRPNLALAVQTVWSPRGRRRSLLQFIQARQGKAGLVYVRSRRDGEDLADWLNQTGFRTAAYHAGLGPAQRRQIEQAWLGGQMPFVVCTSAFGMGINHPHVRWVVHYHAPLLLSEYVQEVGRAGRDGKPAEALTLVSDRRGWLNPDDRQRQQFFIEKARSQHQTAQALIRKLPPAGLVADVARQSPDSAIALALLHRSGQLTWDDPFHYRIRPGAKPQPFQPDPAIRQMQDYLYTRECRWRVLLRSFGFAQEADTLRCGTCDRCGGRS
ncbi:MAG: RecQ family ATP-dependent DNA helicase [Cyanobacteria bacterium J069]